MNANDFRRILEERRDRLVHRYRRIGDDRQNVPETQPGELNEQAQLLENEDVLNKLDESTRAELSAVRGALERVEKGTWDTCERCGEPIEEPRLRALLTTRHCATCAREMLS
jgi:RNA polymerase-binding transcription factor DksA